MNHKKLIKDAQDFFNHNKCSDAIRCWEEVLKLGKSLNNEEFGLMLKPYINIKQESLRRVSSGKFLEFSLIKKTIIFVYISFIYRR